MKKFVLITIIGALLASSLFAAPQRNTRSSQKRYKEVEKDFGLGLNLGYPGSGLAVRYHNEDFRALGAIAFQYSNALAIDFTGEYTFAKIECDESERHVIDLAGGLGAGVVIPFVKGDFVALAFEAGVIANYDVPDTPFSLFLRALYRPTLVFDSKGAFFDPTGFSGSLGFTYNFELK